MLFKNNGRSQVITYLVVHKMRTQANPFVDQKIFINFELNIVEQILDNSNFCRIAESSRLTLKENQKIYFHLFQAINYGWVDINCFCLIKILLQTEFHTQNIDRSHLTLLIVMCYLDLIGSNFISHTVTLAKYYILLGCPLCFWSHVGMIFINNTFYEFG